MSKPFTEDDLARQLTQDLTWRIREISDLKAAVRNADSTGKPALLRAIVTLAYAHWEGHVKHSAEKFLTHVALRKLPFSALNRQFVRNYFLQRLATMAQKSIAERGTLVDLILASGDERFSRVNENLVNTKSNLNSEVLSELCTVCGVNYNLFAEKRQFIDVILLKRRNSIAHGEDTLIGLDELDELTDGALEIMRTFSNELQRIAYLQVYRAA